MMTCSLIVALLLISQILGAVMDSAAPSEMFLKQGLHRWARFKSPNGTSVFINIDEIAVQNSQGEEINVNKVEFHLYTKRNPTNSQRIYINDTSTLNSTNYNPKQKIKIIVHGFMNNINSDTVQSIKNNFLDRDLEDFNIIAVDWSYYTQMYVNVASKSKGVGHLIAQMVDFLVSEGASLSDIHLIGHSMGAHACGFAGTAITSGRISRITGLDPALPGYMVSNRNERLDSMDAEFVDCIHTCAGFLGVQDPICTADFYPNSGKDQPGCTWLDFGTCSHGRSHEFFAESILKGHNFNSLTCLSLNFKADMCIDEGALMGYPATLQHVGILYAITNSEYPYAKNITSGE